MSLSLAHNGGKAQDKITIDAENLIVDDLIFLLLFRTEFEMFGTFDGELFLEFAFGAFHTKNDLLGGFRFLVKDGLLLSTITFLFHVVTTFALRMNTVFAFFVLRHFVQGVLLAVLALAEGSTSLWHVHHDQTCLVVVSEMEKK